MAASTLRLSVSPALSVSASLSTHACTLQRNLLSLLQRFTRETGATVHGLRLGKRVINRERMSRATVTTSIHLTIHHPETGSIIL